MDILTVVDCLEVLMMELFVDSDWLMQYLYYIGQGFNRTQWSPFEQSLGRMVKKDSSPKLAKETKVLKDFCKHTYT